MTAAALILSMEIYLWLGAAFAVVFLAWGIDRIDEDARGAYLFRPLLIPGTLLLWPLVLLRWWRLETGSGLWAQRHRPPVAAHRGLAVAMALGLGLVLATAALVKQDWPSEIAPERLSEPTG